MVVINPDSVLAVTEYKGKPTTPWGTTRPGTTPRPEMMTDLEGLDGRAHPKGSVRPSWPSEAPGTFLMANHARSSILGRHNYLACPTAVKCAFARKGQFRKLSNLPPPLPDKPIAVGPRRRSHPHRNGSRAGSIAPRLNKATLMTTPKPPIDRFHIDHGETGEPPPRQQMNARQMGTAYVYVGATGELIPIPREGDADFDEKMKKVAAALRPRGEIMG
jgi:hypothetical protein